MEYVIPALLLILLIAGFVTFLVLNATRKSGSNAARDGGPPGIGRDATPLGDTDQHAGEQTRAGRTVGGQDASAGHPETGYAQTGPTGADAARDPHAAAHVARPGEAEGEEALRFERREPSRPRGE